VLQDFEGLPVHNFADAVGYGCNTIMKVHLPSGNVDCLILHVA
jgi:hypothetical protein